MSENRHEPSAEFRAFLEWQVSSAVRRQARFAEPVRTRTFNPRTLLIVLLSIALGAAGTVASAQVQETRERSALLELARNELEIAEARLQLVRATYERARADVERGVLARESLRAAELELHAMQSRLAQLQLNVAEIQATGQPPRNEITAPAVNSRDFVSERLRLDLTVAQTKLAAAEQAMREAERKVEVGAAHKLTLVEAQVEAMRQQAEMAVLLRKQAVRRDVLAGKLQPAEANTVLEREQLRRELEVSQHQLALLAQRLELLTTQQRVGVVSDIEVLRAQLEVRERQLEIEALRARIAALNKLP